MASELQQRLNQTDEDIGEHERTKHRNTVVPKRIRKFALVVGVAVSIAGMIHPAWWLYVLAAAALAVVAASWTWAARVAAQHNTKLGELKGYRDELHARIEAQEQRVDTE